MSADNWRECPRCEVVAESERNSKIAHAAEQYGKVPPDEYLRLREDAERERELEETLREDYELGMDDGGRFYVHYSCHCETCGFSHTFSHEEAVSIEQNT